MASATAMECSSNASSASDVSRDMQRLFDVPGKQELWQWCLLFFTLFFKGPKTDPLSRIYLPLVISILRDGRQMEEPDFWIGSYLRVVSRAEREDVMLHLSCWLRWWVPFRNPSTWCDLPSALLWQSRRGTWEWQKHFQARIRDEPVSHRLLVPGQPVLWIRIALVALADSIGGLVVTLCKPWPMTIQFLALSLAWHTIYIEHYRNGLTNLITWRNRGYLQYQQSATVASLS